MGRGRLYPKADSLNRRIVAGERLDCSLIEFMERCALFIEDEQRKAMPDTALIAVLCDAVRLAREYEVSR